MAQYLLRSYATPQTISEVLTSMRDVKQGRSESERDYSDKVKEQFRTRGGVHLMVDPISIYIDGLLQTIRPLISCFREGNKRASYLDVIQFAKEEGAELPCHNLPERLLQPVRGPLISGGVRRC